MNWFALRIHWNGLSSAASSTSPPSFSWSLYRLVDVDMGPTPARPTVCATSSASWEVVPGKAMVIIIRAGMLRGRGVRASVAALATFFETPTSLGAGAAIAFGILASEFGAEVEGRAALLAIAGGLALLLGVLMSPWVFRWILKLVSLPFRADDEEAPAVGMRTRLVLIPLMLAVWALLGASAVACADAVSAEPLSATQWPLLLAATALAMAAGFAVVVMPSGLGVREWVIMEVLAPSLGSEVAVFAAVGLRWSGLWSGPRLGHHLDGWKHGTVGIGPRSRPLDQLNDPSQGRRGQPPAAPPEIATVADAQELDVEVIFIDDRSSDGAGGDPR